VLQQAGIAHAKDGFDGHGDGSLREFPESGYFVTLFSEFRQVHGVQAPARRDTGSMTTTDIPADQLATLVAPDTQRLAARMTQDAFTALFRLTLDADNDKLGATLADIDIRCRNWCQAADGADAQALRMALLISGLDQWGLAYSQAFGLTSIPALSMLLGALRGSLDSTADAHFQRHFERLQQSEGDAVDFRIELRRNIHLALWHAMAACDESEDAQRILNALGSMMLALAQHLPMLGWRLLADALASIQIRLLSDASASPMAQENTRQLFAALRQNLPTEQYQAILAYSSQAFMAWQQSRRPAN
jgi:hypothetical protein